MGIVWFGYWTATRGFGGGLTSTDRDDDEPDESRREREKAQNDPEARKEAEERAGKWVKLVTGTAALGVVGGLLVITAFMVLGAELLAPEGVVPEGTDVAVDLARLFSDVWGAAGRYLLLAAIVVALGGSVLANQDGWGRSFADMTLILSDNRRHSGSRGWAMRSLDWLGQRTGLPMHERRYIKRLYVLTVTGLIPVAIILIFKDPVAVMSASGIIAALHTPFIALSALYVNRTRLPRSLRPGTFITVCMTAAGLFYLGFAGVYLWDLLFNK